MKKNNSCFIFAFSGRTFCLLIGESGDNVFEVEKRKKNCDNAVILGFFLRKKRSLFYPDVEEEQNTERLSYRILLL